MLMRGGVRARGVTLIELLVAMSIFAFLALAAAPSVNDWIRNSRIRTSADSVLQGLQQAKSEAVSRNGRVRFQFTTSADDTCQLSVNGSSWVVNSDPDGNADLVVGACASQASVIQRRAGAEGGAGVTVAAGQTSIVFNGLGRPTPTPAGNITVDFTYPDGGACAADSGTVRCLRIVVSPQGQIRMCDPKLTDTSDPRTC